MLVNNHRLVPLVYCLLIIISYSALTDNTEAQLNTLESIVNQTNVLTSAQLVIGENPRSIEYSDLGGAMYVITGINTVSVIDPITNDVIKNIAVGEGPRAIKYSGYKGVLYVANSVSNTVSVIDPITNDVIKNIPVGLYPRFIEFSPDGDVVYVINYGSNTVSVINATASVINTASNDVIKNIAVGESPNFIEYSVRGGAVYVTNSGSNTVSLFDPATNRVVAGVTFDIVPFRGGEIVCNGLDAPINQYFYLSSGTECIAQPNNGYEFDSWGQVFDDNSTRTINASTPSDSPLATLRDAFSNEPDPASNLTVNKFGNFTTYFRALPPPVPAEFTASLITVIVAALVGSLLIPATLSWLKSKKQTSRLNSFHQQMDLIYADRKLDKNETDQSNRLNKDISDSYAAGKISNEQYTHLKNEVSTAYQEIFKKRIESITDPNTEDLGKINNDITNAYSNGKLSNEHYTNLKNEVSNVYQKIFKKRIESLTDPDIEAISKIRNDIRDAYADGKITEMHYKLLNEKISDMSNNK